MFLHWQLLLLLDLLSKCSHAKSVLVNVPLYHKVEQLVVGPRLCGATELTCHVDLCSVTCENFHLKIHIKDRKTVACPFKQCEKQFQVFSTFTSHMSRKHRTSPESSLVDSVVGASVVKPGISRESKERDEQLILTLMFLVM